MRLHALRPTPPGYTPLAALLLCILFLSPVVVLAGQTPLDTLDPHGGHGAEHADHSRHHVPAGVHRSRHEYSTPSVTLIDQDARRIPLQELLDGDRPVMLNFIFTSCTAICPAMSATFAGVQTRLGDDAERLRMVSISIDPEHDTPATLEGYAQRFDAGPQWTFLTGSLDDVIRVQQAFDADRGDKMNHAPLTLLRGAANGPWIRYDGFATPDELARQCRKLLSGDSPETGS